MLNMTTTMTLVARPSIAELKPISRNIYDTPYFELKVYDIQTTGHIRDENVHGEDLASFAEDIKVKRRRLFYVSKDVVCKASYSAELCGWLQKAKQKSGKYFMETARRTESVDAMEIILRAAHGTPDPLFLNVKMRTIWSLWLVCNHLQIQAFGLKVWFEQWYSDKRRGRPLDSVPREKIVPFVQQLFYPAYWFNHQVAFTWASKKLIYKGRGGLMQLPKELNLPVTWFMIDGDVLRQLRNAKRSVLNVLERNLYACCRRISHESSDVCCCIAFQRFFAHLQHSCDVWPFLDHIRNTIIDEICERLDSRFRMTPISAENGCGDCVGDYKPQVEEVVKKAQEHIDGLCLDCIHDSSRQKPADLVYYEKMGTKTWDLGCKVNHGQPTWYHSCAGDAKRREEMHHKRSE